MKRAFLVLFLIMATELSASTVIVNSVFNNDQLPGSSLAAAAVEDGLMDILFDSGFIMFSTYNSTDYNVEGAKDARYMITIEPLVDDFAVSFTLQATINGMVIEKGIVDLATIHGDSSIEDMKLYYLIGKEVAAKLLNFL